MRGRVSVGATLPAGELDVPRLLVSFSEAFPGIEIDLHEGTAGDMRTYLAEDRVDAAFSLLALDPPAGIEVEHLSNLTQEEAIEVGTTIGALIGLGIEGEEGMEAGAMAGAEAAADHGIDAFSGEEWDVIEEIPNDSAAALILLEHRWAIPLRDAIASAGGFRIADGFISPLDLVEIGLISAEEAKEHHLMETAAATH